MYHARVVITKKIMQLSLGCGFAFLILLGRLFYLQVFCVDHCTSLSIANFTRQESIFSARGSICDRDKKFLATNRPCTCVVWQGTGKSFLSDAQESMLREIEVILERPLALSGDTIAAIERKRGTGIVASDITFEQLSKISELFSSNPNITLKTQFKRFYPYGRYGCHLVGHLGNIRSYPRGQLGLERVFDEHLSGRDGAVRHVINSRGHYMSGEEIEKPSIGDTIYTTLSMDLQEICEKVFPQDRAGSFILLDPVMGDVISLVSRPNFDPNVFLMPISSTLWDSLQKNNAFLNRSINASYPSGSIFKLVTASVALEQGLINQEEKWNCKGYTVFGKRKYWCSRRAGHGDISLTQAVAESCNTLFFEIGKKIDIDILADYAHRFGLGEKTTLLFPAKVGLVPSREWKMSAKGERWWPGETLSVTIGQSFLLVTPMQIARMIGSIFTGYLITPRFILDEPIITEPLLIEPSTREFLKKYMKMVVRQGTGKSIRQLKDIKIYAKTSTAQTSDFSKRKLHEKYLEHGWFVGYFYYKDAKPLVIVVLVEHAGTAQTALTIAKQFFMEYKKYVDRQ